MIRLKPVNPCTQPLSQKLVRNDGWLRGACFCYPNVYVRADDFIRGGGGGDIAHPEARPPFFSLASGADVGYWRARNATSQSPAFEGYASWFRTNWQEGGLGNVSAADIKANGSSHDFTFFCRVKFLDIAMNPLPSTYHDVIRYTSKVHATSSGTGWTLEIRGGAYSGPWWQFGVNSGTAYVAVLSDTTEFISAGETWDHFLTYHYGVDPAWRWVCSRVGSTAGAAFYRSSVRTSNVQPTYTVHDSPGTEYMWFGNYNTLSGNLTHSRLEFMFYLPYALPLDSAVFDYPYKWGHAPYFHIYRKPSLRLDKRLTVTCDPATAVAKSFIGDVIVSGNQPVTHIITERYRPKIRSYANVNFPTPQEEVSTNV